MFKEIDAAKAISDMGLRAIANKTNRVTAIKVEGYGKLLILFGVNSCVIHSTPDRFINLKNTVKAFDEIIANLIEVDMKRIVAHFETAVTRAQHRFLTKYLKFKSIGYGMYLREL